MKLRESTPPIAEHNSALTPAIITSFCAGGFFANELCKSLSCDLYLMMEGDVLSWCEILESQRSRGLRRFWRHRHPKSAVEFLASLNATEIRQISKSIAAKADCVEITSISSFLPEIAYHPWTSRARRAVSALKNLMRLAFELRQLGHPVHTVETTAGSRVRGIRLLPPSKYVAVLNSVELSHRYLCKNLTAVLKGLNGRIVPLALELEPGPYFLLRNFSSLKSFGKLISERELLNEWVGFNLDISHWRLAGIAPGEFESESTHLVYDKVFNAHISGHHQCAHFGDIPLFDINHETEFTPWIAALQRLSGRKDTLYRGGISLELEAVQSKQVLTRAISEFTQLLA